MKVKLGGVPLICPVPVVLAGAEVNGRANFTTLGDCGIMGLNPPLVYVSLHEKHHSTAGIQEKLTFSVNVPSESMIAVTDHCGIVSGRDVDKSALFSVFYGELGTAPMISECPVCLECRVVKSFGIQHRRIFVGEVVQTYVNEECVEETSGRPEIRVLSEIAPITYGLDNRYYGVGKVLGSGYTHKEMPV